MTTRPIRVFFQNTPGRVGPVAAWQLLNRVTRNHDVGAFAEAGHLTRRLILNRLRNRKDNPWDAFAGEGVGNLWETPILWRRSRWEFVAALPVRHYPDTRVGSWGAGPDVMRTGHTNAVILRDRLTGLVHGFAAGHWVPSVTQDPDKLTPAARRGWAARRALHQAETRGAVWLSVRARDLVIPPNTLGNETSLPQRVTTWTQLGDFNATPGHKGLQGLWEDTGHRPVFPGPTMHGRKIDGGYVWPTQTVVTDPGTFPPARGGDHRGIRFTLQPFPVEG